MPTNTPTNAPIDPDRCLWLAATLTLGVRGLLPPTTSPMPTTC